MLGREKETVYEDIQKKYIAGFHGTVKCVIHDVSSQVGTLYSPAWKATFVLQIQRHKLNPSLYLHRYSSYPSSSHPQQRSLCQCSHGPVTQLIYSPPFKSYILQAFWFFLVVQGRGLNPARCGWFSKAIGSQQCLCWKASVAARWHLCRCKNKWHNIWSFCMGNNTVTYAVSSVRACSSCKQVQNFLWIGCFSTRSQDIRKTPICFSLKCVSMVGPISL